MSGRQDGILLGYLPAQGVCELKAFGTLAVTTHTFTPKLRDLTRAQPGYLRPLLNNPVRLYFHPDLPELVEKIEWIDA